MVQESQAKKYIESSYHIHAMRTIISQMCQNISNRCQLPNVGFVHGLNGVV